MKSELEKDSIFILTINMIKEVENKNRKSCDVNNKIEKYAMEILDIYVYN